MKVVHITTMDHGGAGIAARRIHEALLQLGVESRMLVRYKTSDDDTITEAHADMGLYRPSRIPIVERVVRAMRRRGKYLTEVERYERQLALLDRQYGAAFTLPISNFDLAKHPLVQEADIIHLHWVENFLDYPTFFNQVKKPIVWTFHDENIAYGGFHYSEEATRLKEPFAELEHTFTTIKRDVLATATNVHMVALCQPMLRFYHEKALHNRFPVEVIYNGIRPDDFQMRNRVFCREIFGLPPDCFIIFFCATDINDPHKGLNTLIRSLAGINDSLKIALLCVGSGVLPEANFPIVGTGSINNPRLLSLAYSAADLFVMPSSQESFGQTPIEATACGCPVVAFQCGIIDELINEANGIRCPDFTCESLSEAILSATKRHYDRDTIRRDVLTRFDISLIAQQYLDLYNRCKS